MGRGRELLQGLRSFEKGKIVTAREAVQLIHDGDTIATSGFVGIGFPENIAVALEQRFVESSEKDPDGVGKPEGLTLVYAAGQGDGKERGLNHLGHAGTGKARDRRTLGTGAEAAGAGGRQPDRGVQPAAGGDHSPVSRHRRAQAGPSVAHRTWARSSTRATAAAGSTSAPPKTLVELMTIGGEEYLFYKAFPIHVGIVRGTTADPDGNITMEREALTLEALAIAMAARNSGGIVIVQVERIAERGSLNPRQVKIPGVLVDCVVVAEKPEYHMQTFVEQYNPGFAGEIRVPVSSLAPMPMSERKIIARRAALELQANSVVNLGIGMPEGVVRGRDRGKGHRPADADGRARCGRRHPGFGAQLRRRGQHAGDHRPAVPVRLLRWRRTRPRVPRTGAGRSRGQSERQQVRTAAGRRRRIHQHLAVGQARGVRRHVHRGRPAGQGRGWPARAAERHRAEEVRRAGRAPHLFRQRSRAARPAGALRHRALRACGWRTTVSS